MPVLAVGAPEASAHLAAQGARKAVAAPLHDAAMHTLRTARDSTSRANGGSGADGRKDHRLQGIRKVGGGEIEK